jgi:hypothetical protein
MPVVRLIANGSAPASLRHDAGHLATVGRRDLPATAAVPAVRQVDAP